MFNAGQFPFGKMKSSWRWRAVVTAARPRDCAKCHRTAHRDVVAMGNFTLCVSYYHQKKKKPTKLATLVGPVSAPTRTCSALGPPEVPAPQGRPASHHAGISKHPEKRQLLSLPEDQKAG